MPMFYFHVSDDHKITDIDGTELKDLAAARSHAIVVAKELMFNRDGMLGREWSDWNMSVRDEGGNDVFSFVLNDIASGRTKN